MKSCSASFVLLAILSGFSITPSYAQRLALTKTQFIGGTHNGAIATVLYQAIPTRDGGSIVCSMTKDSGTADIPRQPHAINDSGDVILIKLDSNGNKQWVKTYGGLGPEGGKSICQTPDGGYAVLTGSGNRLGDFKFDRLDANGNFLWSSKNYGSSRQEGITEIISTPDHGFLMAGNSMGADGDIPFNYRMPLIAFQPADWVLIKTDSLGNKQWVRVLGTSLDESFGYFSVVSDGANYYAVLTAQTKDHDCVDSSRLAVGYTGNSPYVIKLDANGNTIWSKAVGGGYVSRAIFDPRDSSIVVTGEGSPAFEFQSGHGSSDISLFKIDRNGQFKWGRLYGGSTYDYAGSLSIRFGPNGGYCFAGTSALGNGTSNGWLFLTDSIGNVVTENQFGNLGEHGHIIGVTPVTDGVIVIGNADSYQFTEGSGFNYLFSDPKLAGYYPNNLIVSHFQLWPAGIANASLSKGLRIFPNPARQHLSISLPRTELPGHIRCLDASGHIALEQATPAGQQTAIISSASWAPGNYIILWQDNSMQAPISAKVMIQ